MKPIPYFLVGCMLIFLMTFISAEKIIQESRDTEVQIRYPNFNYYKLNTNVSFNIQVINTTDGLRYNFTNMGCYGQIYDNYGNWVYPRQNMTWSSTYESWRIDNIIFNNTGKYELIVYCVNTSAGYVSLDFEVTPTGSVIDVGSSFVYILFILLIIGLLIGSVKLVQKYSISSDFEVSSASYSNYTKNKFKFYVDVLKSKMYIVGIFGVYIGTLLLVTFGASLASLSGLTEIVELLLPFTIILGWGTVPFIIFWVVYLIIYLVTKVSDILMYQYGRIKR